MLYVLYSWVLYAVGICTNGHLVFDMQLRHAHIFINKIEIFDTITLPLKWDKSSITIFHDIGNKR